MGVHNAILTGIRDGSFQPDSRLPSEGILSQRIGASRATVREALTELERAGYIIRRHGSGTYVAPRAAIAHSRIDRFTTLTEVIQENGHAPSIVEWRVDLVTPPTLVARALELSRADRAWRVTRTYLAGRVPAAFCVGYVPEVWHGRAVTIPRAPAELRWAVEEALGVTVTHLVTSVEAVPASSECAGALRVPEGTPLLLNASLNLLDDGRPVLYGLNYCDTTVMQMNLVQVRPAAGHLLV
jgi:GntR family transcriptional regulator